MEFAMRSKDPAFNGKFFVGVHSTGIFCLPSCRARPPLLKNVRFYPSVKAARSAGLRACKRCRPERFPDTSPNWAEKLTSYLNSHPGTRLAEIDLARLAGVDITTVRRNFKQRHHTTPLAWHRKLRLEHARKLMAQGTSYLAAAYECGWESASGFRAAYERQFGRPPGRVNGHRSHRLS